MIPQGTLTQLRRGAERTLLNRCTIEHSEEVTRPSGSKYRTPYAVVATDVPCGMQITANDKEHMDIAAMVQKPIYKFRFAVEQEITLKDRITVKEEKYEVVFVSSTHAMSLFRIVLATEV